jgi:CubicO group peptidase (beta-lactamase class C family)
VRDELDAIVRSRPVDVPGIAIGVAIDGETRLVTDGVTNVDHALPVDSGTLFQLGSVSKTFTATAALALVDRGVLSLDGLVSPWLQDVDFGESAATLTVRHLLTHRGGWQGDWALFNAPRTRDAAALRALVSMTPSVPRYGPPGGPFSYDNFGYCVLGAVIEAATGRSFADAVASLVCKPLVLNDTLFRADDAIGRTIAVGHRARSRDGGVRTAEGSEPWADRWPTRRALWPTGGVVSTLADTMRWAKFHLDGSTAGDAPISDATRTMMQEPQSPSGGQGVEVALGWHVRYASGVRVLSHTGAAQGFFSHVAIVPERAAAMVVLTNGADGSSVAAPTFRWFIERRLGLSMDAPTIIQAVRDPDSLDGTYHAESRTIRLHTGVTGEVVAEVNDTGPTWGGTWTAKMRFADGDRLIGVDDATFRMEFGTFDDGRPWLRFRGRIHIPTT